MCFQNCESPHFNNFGIPNFGVRRNDIWVQGLWLGTENTIRGKVVVPPSLGHGDSCEFVFACGSFVHQKCSNCALPNLLFGLCMSMWIIDSLVTCFSLHPKALAPLSILEVLQIRERTPTPYPSVVFTLDLQLNLSRCLRVCQCASPPSCCKVLFICFLILLVNTIVIFHKQNWFTHIINIFNFFFNFEQKNELQK